MLASCVHRQHAKYITMLRRCHKGIQCTVKLICALVSTFSETKPSKDKNKSHEKPTSKKMLLMVSSDSYVCAASCWLLNMLALSLLHQADGTDECTETWLLEASICCLKLSCQWLIPGRCTAEMCSHSYRLLCETSPDIFRVRRIDANLSRRRQTNLGNKPQCIHQHSYRKSHELLHLVVHYQPLQVVHVMTASTTSEQLCITDFDMDIMSVQLFQQVHAASENPIHDDPHVPRCSTDRLLQAVALGTWLRNRYTGAAGLLPDAYSKDSVLAHSTNYRRTRATMHGVLLGLYPSASEDFRVETSQHDDELMLYQA
jgi:hypothetical protein